MHWSCLGHKTQKTYLGRLLDEGRLAHAYLFVGPEGIGKRMIAEDIARALLGTAGPSFDILRLEPQHASDPDGNAGRMQDIPIDAIRALRAWLVLRPTGTHKVVILDGADHIGAEAANTLLKIVEEPPAYARLFFVSDRPNAILPTLASRCEAIMFYPLEDSDFQTALGTQKISADDRALLAALAVGRPGAALRMLHEKKLLVAGKSITALQKALRAGTIEQFALAKTVAASPDADAIVSWWLAFVHAKLGEKPALAPVAKGLLELSKAFHETGINRRLALERFFLELQ